MTPHYPMNNPLTLLRKGAEILEIPLEEDAVEKMGAYARRLLEWGRRTNLTSIFEPADVIERHFLDSLTVLKVMPETTNTAVDIGSGAGFPGMVVKIARPELRLSFIEPNTKKLVFLKVVANDLGLRDLTFHNMPFERLVRKEEFDCVLSRAFSSDKRVLGSFATFLHPAGSLVRMTGPALRNADLALDSFRIVKTWEGALPLSGQYRRVILYARTSVIGDDLRQEG